MTRLSVRSAAQLLAAISVVLASSVIFASPVAAASTLGLDKLASVGSTTPGADFTYTLTARCSGLTEACINPLITDVLPPEIDATALPPSTAERTVSFDPGTRALTVAFIIPLTPPSPPGSVGLPAGSSRSVQLGVRVPQDTTAADNTVIANVATAKADNTGQARAEADVTLQVPRTVRPVATKAWADGSAVAGSGAPGTITLGVRNGSSSSAQVTALSVREATPTTFDRFDVTGIGPVTFPPGANRVSVAACTVVLSACSDSQYTTGPPQTGPTLTLPAGIAAADVTGLRFVFTAADGSPITAGPNAGSVAIGTVLRDTLRSTGESYRPATRDDVLNCVTPVAADTELGAVAGAEACATYSVQPAQATIAVGKTFFSDTNGDYKPDGQAVFEQNSLVSGLITARNTSPFAVATMTITEPSTTSPSEFSKMDVTSMRVTFPAGATQARVAVTCPGGAVLDQDLIAPPTTVDVASPCPAGPPTSITVTFTGQDPAGAGTINPASAAVLGFQGRLNDTVTADDVVGGADEGVSDCADATATSAIDGVGAAAGTGCATVAVQPAFAKVTGIKSSTLPTILPGLPRDFSLSFTNRGTIAAGGVTLLDPADPTAADNPFLQIRLSALTVPATPDATVELFDPNTGGYVAYDAGDPALLERSLGFRVRLTDPLAPGQKYALTARVLLRDGVALGTRLQNCAAVGDDTQEPAPFCAPVTTVTAQSSGAAVQKAISPADSVRPQPGLSGQTIQVKLAAQNTGTLWLKRLAVIDTDTAFFDAVDVTGTIRVNYPPAANRVQVDVCTGVCGPTDFIDGAPQSGQTPALPGGVDLADIRGFRFTFTAVGTGVAGDFAIRPGTNFPTTGACTAASICLDVKPRAALHSDPAAATPDQLVDTASGGYESTAQAGNLAPVPNSTATHTLTTGTGRLLFTKAPDTSAGPGDAVPVTLSAANTGSGPIPNPQIVDPLPAQLEFSPTDPAVPYTISYSLPAGAPEPPTVEFTPVTDDNGTVTSLRWAFPGWDLVPGGSVTVTFQTVLTPGVTAGQTILNRAGGTGDRPDLACEPGAPRAGQETDNPVYGDGLYCTSASQVSTLAGNAFRAEKWVAGDPALGWLNSVTGELLPLGDASCPRLSVEDQLFTRYPCVARVLPGQGFDFYLRLINAGTNPATEVRLVDVLPAPGDTGVILTDDERGTQWDPAPTLLRPVTLEGTGALDIGYANAGPYCTTDLDRPPADCGTAWDGSYGQDATAFRAVVTFADGLPPGGGTALKFRMRAPAAPTNPSQDEIAWNSFAHTDFFSDGGRIVQLPATEPIKTGVALVYGSVAVRKELGPGVDPAAGPFDFEVECTVAPENPDGEPGPPVVVRNTTFSLLGGQGITAGFYPAGARCLVWETNSQGLISDADSRETAKSLTVPIGNAPEDAAVVTITNQQPPPPSTTPTTPTSSTTTPTTPTANTSPTTTTAITTSTSTNTSTSTPPPPPPTGPPPPGDGGTPSGGGQLPTTGVPADHMAALGSAALLAGLLLLVVARRRRRNTTANLRG